VQTPWFFAERSSWSGDRVVLSADESHHAIRVLRIGPSDVVTVTDGAGTVARCKVAELADGLVVADVLERATSRRPGPELAVFQGAPRGRKADDVIERLAELGAVEVLVFEGRRSVVRWDRDRSDRLAERWRTIARGAAKQSRSPFVMRTGPVVGWGELLERVRAEPCPIALWEEASVPLRAALADRAQRVALLVGPEGGLDGSEADALAAAGAKLVSLGPRILRTENAPVVAAAAVLFHYGVIG
jgi:16S rRNA (uracil1498-N3)-methyltransferase